MKLKKFQNIKFKKISLPVVVGVISFYFSLLFCFGVILGYVLTKYLSCKVKSIKFSLKSYQVHLHHWLCASFALVILFLSGLYQMFSPFLLGTAAGVVFEGIYRYDDWHRVLIKKK